MAQAVVRELQLLAGQAGVAIRTRSAISVRAKAIERQIVRSSIELWRRNGLPAKLRLGLGHLRKEEAAKVEKASTLAKEADRSMAKGRMR